MSLTLTVMLPLFVAVGLLPAFALVLRRISARGRHVTMDREWLDGLAASRWKAMGRLVDGRDLAYIASQPGTSPAMVRCFRSQRVQLFRMYTEWLNEEFDRVCTAMKVLIIYSQVDRPDLAALLIKTRLRFAVCLMVVEYRLVFIRFGMSEVRIGSLVSSLDALQLTLRELMSVQPAAA